MYTISINFDLDDTIISQGWYEEIRWNGGVALWQALCEQLVQFGAEHDVKIVFGIITAKDGSDRVVEEAIIGLQNYLFIQPKKQFSEESKEEVAYPLVTSKKYFYAYWYDHVTDFPLHLETPQPLPIESEPAYRQLVLLQEAVYSPIFITVNHKGNKKEKFECLEIIKNQYGIEDEWQIFLVDDYSKNLKLAINHGFSVVSAENMPKAQSNEERDLIAQALCKTIFNTVQSKIVSLVDKEKDAVSAKALVVKSERSEIMISQSLATNDDALNIPFEDWEEENTSMQSHYKNL